MKLSPVKTAILTFAAASLLAGSTSAATLLFEDTFDRTDSNTVGNGWSERQRNARDVSIRNNSLLLRDFRSNDPSAAAGSQVIDATGFENITVTFRWRSLNNNEADDTLLLSWDEAPAPNLGNEAAWTQVFSGGSASNNNISETITLAGAEDSLFNIMFWTQVDERNEGFRIREVTVMGDAIAPVPLPASMPLMLAGLGALSVARRRKKKA